MTFIATALAIVGALAAMPAVAGVYWRGDTTPRTVVMIDISTLEPRPNGGTSFILRALSPPGTRMNGREIAITSFYTLVNCDAGTVRVLGGTVFGENAEVVAQLAQQPRESRPSQASPGWRHLRLACARTDEERAQFGVWVGEATLDELLRRFRPKG